MPTGIYPRNTTVIDRFWRRVIIQPSGCWEWQGFLQNGYGFFWMNGRSMRPQRFSFTYFTSKVVPSGFDLDHLCRNRKCVNPNHLEIVTRRENLRRGSPKRLYGTCWRGHLLGKNNIYWRKDRPGRWNCLQCRRENRAMRRVILEETKPRVPTPAPPIPDADQKLLDEDKY